MVDNNPTGTEEGLQNLLWLERRSGQGRGVGYIRTTSHCLLRDELTYVYPFRIYWVLVGLRMFPTPLHHIGMYL